MTTGSAEPAPATRELLLLFSWAAAVRLATLVAAAHVTGWAPLDLAMLADGHSDMVLSKTFPSLYVGTQQLVPFVTTWRDDPYAFFTRFPLYPSAIALASLALDDLRLAALAVSQLAGALAVVRFRLLAGSFTRRPALAAVLFAVFPATWLETSSLAYTEGLLVLCSVSAFGAWTRGRLGIAIAWAGAASVVQKHGFLLLLALAGAQLVAGRRRLRDLAPLAFGLLPGLALGLYLWALSGDPFTVVERLQRLFGDGQSAWSWPLVAFANGILTEGREFSSHFWLRKAMLVASLAFYGSTLWAALVRRDALEAPLVVWLCLPFALCSIMGGIWAYYNFPRLMLMAAPAALLLAVDRVPWPRRRAPLALVLGSIALACVVAAVLGTQSMWELCMHVWSPRYYEQLRTLLH